MDEVTKKRISIGIAVTCIALAIVITVVTNWDGSGGGAKPGPIQMLCTNEECGYAFELSPEEFRSQIESLGPMGMPGMMSPQMPALTCPKCGQQSAYVAQKCEKCGTVFIPDYTVVEDYPDRCPNCGYSKSEEIYNKTKEKQE